MDDRIWDLAVGTLNNAQADRVLASLTSLNVDDPELAYSWETFELDCRRREDQDDAMVETLQMVTVADLVTQVSTCIIILFQSLVILS